MNDLNELETLIVGWAKARGIVPNATPESQVLKAVSEMGELADAVLKGQEAEMKEMQAWLDFLGMQADKPMTAADHAAMGH